LPAISTRHFILVQKLYITSSSQWNNNNHYNIMWIIILCEANKVLSTSKHLDGRLDALPYQINK
jgi:hypothetical protein